MTAAPKQTDPQFKLRMPPELKNQIEVASNVNGRSMNAEIIERLAQSFTVGVLDDGERREHQRRIAVLIDNQARMKDHFKDALNALASGDADKALQILTPLAWYEQPATRDSVKDGGT